jgi:hypothetical protein
MNKFKQVVLASLVFSFVFFAPASTAEALTATNQPETTAELIAYLQGRIAQLLEMQRLLESSGQNNQNFQQSTVKFVSINTRKAADVEETTAVFRGEAIVYGGAKASVWFEFGQEEDFLDFRSRIVTIQTEYDRAVRVPVINLRDDKRYYFRMVAKDQAGNVTYGKIFSFRTDEPDDDDD